MVIPPYDLGTNQVLEDYRKIDINDLVRDTQKRLKISLLEADIQVLGVDIALTTSQTNYAGKRFWFVCPNCNKRVGVLYKHVLAKLVGCQSCLGLLYRQQRYRGMIEAGT